jgi:hypothetical protein
MPHQRLLSLTTSKATLNTGGRSREHMHKQESDLTHPSVSYSTGVLNLDLVAGHQHARDRVNQRRTIEWRWFQLLNCTKQPGLTEDQFRGLFFKCGVCGIVTTRQVFSFHECESTDAPTDVEDFEEV